MNYLPFLAGLGAGGYLGYRAFQDYQEAEKLHVRVAAFPPDNTSEVPKLQAEADRLRREALLLGGAGAATLMLGFWLSSNTQRR